MLPFKTIALVRILNFIFLVILYLSSRIMSPFPNKIGVVSSIKKNFFSVVDEPGY
jgi:hypothetical protein